MSAAAKKERLDLLLVQRNLAESRQQPQRQIIAGALTVDGWIVIGILAVMGVVSVAVMLGKTLWSNVLTGATGLPENIAAYFELIKDFRPEGGISDFESWTYLYAKTHRLPILSIDNMQIINRCTLPESVLAGHKTEFQLTKAFIKSKLYHYPHEVFACLFLDNRHQVLRYEELFNGTIDGASVHPREVVRRALELGAAAVIFAHNHPSGVTEPSQADLRITQRLKDALALVDVRVLDPLLVGDGQGISFAERGLL